MKKLYLLSLLFCAGFAARAGDTATIYAAGLAGSYTTASALEALPAGTWTIGEGTIEVTNSSTAVQAGYANFDISSIPVGATIAQVTLGVDRNGYTAGIYNICTTYGHTVDLSTIPTGAALYTACTTTGSGGTALWSAAAATDNGSYGSGVGDTTMVSIPGPTGAACSFIQTCRTLGTVTNTVSISFSIASSTNVYNFTGESGTKDTAGLHAPYLIIIYCFQPTSVTAVASPTTLCQGDSLHLSGTATGASSYKWAGNAGFTATGTNLDTAGIVTNVGAVGAYTLTAYANCGTFMDSTVAYTGSIVVNSTPPPITISTNTLCQGDSTVLTDFVPGGFWTSSNTIAATLIAATNVATVTAVSAGTSVISYTFPTGSCAATTTITVNDPPGPVSGPAEVCASGGNITLVDSASGGTWSSNNTMLATIDPGNGLVTGVATGSATISYYTGGCDTVAYPVTIEPLPTAIIGPAVVCVNANISLNDATAGGVWSSGNVSLATVVTGAGNTGIVTGAAAGVVTITYTLPTGCYVTMPVTVNAVPANITGTAAVCIGQATILYDATTGGTWSSSNNPVATVGLSTGVVSGVTANGVTISYTLSATGCFSTYPFTVNPLPDAITGATAVCVQSTITLNDASPAGNWSSEASSVATAGAGSGVVTGVAGGTTNITYTLSATGCYTAYAVTVNPLPTAAITASGPVTFCLGGSVTLNATVAAGYAYQWFSNGAPVIGENTATYVSTTTELVTVQITNANGCVNTSAGTQVSLVQNAVVTAGGPVIFCQTGNVQLSVPLAPDILYQWSFDGSPIGGANANTYSATQNGTYTCYLDVPGGCTATTPAFNVTVHPLPVPVVTIAGTQLTATNGFTSYQWYLNGLAIRGATTNIITPTSNGAYTVRVTDGNGCEGYSSGYIVNDLAVQLINKAGIKIYPNPANSVVHIESPAAVRAVVSDIAGKTLLEVTDATDINISSLADGVYMIMLYDNNGDRLLVQKLVKE